MLQRDGLIRGVTVSETVGLFAALYPSSRPVDVVLAEAGLADLGDRRIEHLSGGQTQHLRFALAIVGDAQIIFLDEPTAGMDLDSRAAFWDSMRSWAQIGRTLLFATHYLEEVEAAADRVLLLRRGALVADTSLNDLQDSGERTISFLDNDLPEHILAGLPGVISASTSGARTSLRSADSDATLAALLATSSSARSVEVAKGALQEALRELTRNES